MQALVDVILPVFLLIGFGYLAAATGRLSAASVDTLMNFTQTFAIPALLFLGIVGLDLGAQFDPVFLGVFYTGAVAGFAMGMLGARFFFGRPWEDAVAVGFIGLFSNSVLLGLPITERAFGSAALAPNYAIIAMHSPFCYAVGITAMELVRGRARGEGLVSTLGNAALGVMNNPLVIGLALGFGVNLSGLVLPGALSDALDLMARAGLPVALFALGGVLVRYRPEGDLWLIGWALTASLVLHPAVVWGLGQMAGLDTGQFRSALVTAAMPPGVNTFLFANMYGAARRVAASSALLGTLLAILTSWLWLATLP